MYINRINSEMLEFSPSFHRRKKLMHGYAYLIYYTGVCYKKISKCLWSMALLYCIASTREWVKENRLL